VSSGGCDDERNKHQTGVGSVAAIEIASCTKFRMDTDAAFGNGAICTCAEITTCLPSHIHSHAGIYPRRPSRTELCRYAPMVCMRKFKRKRRFTIQDPFFVFSNNKIFTFSDLPLTYGPVLHNVFGSRELSIGFCLLPMWNH